MLCIPPRRNDAEEVPGSVKAEDGDPQAQLSLGPPSGRTSQCDALPRAFMIQAASKIVNSTLEYPSSTLDRGSLFPERTILLSVAVP